CPAAVRHRTSGFSAMTWPCSCCAANSRDSPAAYQAFLTSTSAAMMRLPESQFLNVITSNAAVSACPTATSRVRIVAENSDGNFATFVSYCLPRNDTRGRRGRASLSNKKLTPVDSLQKQEEQEAGAPVTSPRRAVQGETAAAMRSIIVASAGHVSRDS